MDSEQIKQVMKAWGSKGGKATKKKLGKAHYKRMGKLSGQARKLKKQRIEIEMMPGNIIDGREYCHSCGTNITIIESHSCLEGYAFGTVLPIKLSPLRKLS